MDATPHRVRLVVSPGIGPARTRALVTWLRALVPAAALVLATPGTLPDDDDVDTISIDADAVPSGPLSLADLIVRTSRH